MHALLIPVRSRTGAKNRLARVLDPGERERLTVAMLTDMVTAAERTSTLDGVWVVSADEGLLAHARTLGAKTLFERDIAAHAAVAPVAPNGGLNRAVWTAACELERSAVRTLVTIPGDVPLVRAGEIDALVAAGRRAQVVLAPSGSGTGTNALVATPPTVLVPRFEGGSLEAYRRACATAGIDARLLALEGLYLDVDTVEDLKRLARSDRARLSAEVASALLATRARTVGAAGRQPPTPPR